MTVLGLIPGDCDPVVDEWLALQREWVRDGMSDADYIAAATRIGCAQRAREHVAIYHEQYETKGWTG